MPTESMLTYALHYLELGWNVIPVGADKRPRLPRWEQYQHQRVTKEEIAEWWGRWPESNIAIVTGRVSDMVVVDVDDEEGARALEPHLNGTKTLSAVTGSGGRHYYFKHPGGDAVPNAVRLLPGVDVRGDGGYVVAPPSKHASGQSYRWENTEEGLSSLPLGLLGLTRHSGPSRRLEPKDWQTDIKEGIRDQEITRRAGRLIQVGMPATEVLTVVRSINQTHCKPPLPDAQLQKIVASIASREAAKPKVEAPAPAAKPGAFTVLTQREMLRKYSEGETRWTVAEWLPEASCGLLVAPPGNHKTWLLAALAFAVATGRPFLNRWPVQGKGPVLFIQQEDPWWMLQSRLARMFNPPEPAALDDGSYELDCRYVPEFDSMPVYWYTDRELHFSDKNMLGRLEQKIAELRPRLVMIDPLYTAADSKDYMAEGAQKMAALKSMRDKYGCSFVIAHHTTVAGSSSEDRSAIWGSQFLNAWLEFGWRMPKGDDTGTVMVRHFKSCENPKRIKLAFKITDWSFDVGVDDAPTTTADRIEEVILGGNAGSMRNIAKAAGVSAPTVLKIIKKMGLVRGADGQYKLPDGESTD